MNKEKIAHDIYEDLYNADLSLADVLEVFGNVLIKTGVDYIDLDNPPENEIELASIIIEDIRKNGETLPNAVVRQGMTILTWINNIENE